MDFIEYLRPARLLIDITVFCFGACIGSFLNVVICRLPKRQSLIHPASHCPKCSHPIRPWENIPILSWIFLRGRCSACGTGISTRYPAVEAFTALIFLLIWQNVWSADLLPQAIPAAFFLAAAMIAVGFIDAEHRIIPNRLTATIFALGLLLAVIWPEGRIREPPSLILDIFTGHGLRNTKDLADNFWQYRIMAIGKSIEGAAVIFIILFTIRAVASRFWGRTTHRCGDPGEKFVITENSIKIGDKDLEKYYAASTNPKRKPIILHAESAEIFEDETYSGKSSKETKQKKPVSTSPSRILVYPDSICINHELHSRRKLKKLTGRVLKWSTPREVLGWGDIKLLTATSAFLGLQPVLTIILISSILGIGAGLTILLTTKGKKGNIIPYAPWICAAALIWILAEDKVSLWLFPLVNQ